MCAWWLWWWWWWRWLVPADEAATAETLQGLPEPAVAMGGQQPDVEDNSLDDVLVDGMPLADEADMDTDDSDDDLPF